MNQRSNLDRNTRLGIQLFLFYTVIYLAYVLVNAFAPAWADREVLAGLNLAVVWGFALIALAFILAIVYGSLCGSEAATPPPSTTESGEGSE